MACDDAHKAISADVPTPRVRGNLCLRSVEFVFFFFFFSFFSFRFLFMIQFVVLRNKYLFCRDSSLNYLSNMRFCFGRLKMGKHKNYHK